MKRILISGNYGAGNLGDDAILGGILTDLKTIGFRGKIAITHGGLNTSPDIYGRHEQAPFVPSGLRSRLRFSQVRAARSVIRSADLVIHGGGGLYSDGESWRAPMIWSRQCSMYQRLRTPYITYGQSLGPLTHKASQIYAKSAFSKAEASHFRDSASAKLLKKLTGRNSEIGTDAALSYLQALKQETKAPKKADILAINFRLWPGVNLTQWQELLQPILEISKDLKLKPVLFTMEPHSKEEIKALESLGLEMLVVDSAKILFNALRKARLAVNMRLHASIFTLMADVPTLALSYSSKVENLMKDLDAKGLICRDLKNTHSKQIKKDLLALSEQKVTLNIEPKIQVNQAFLQDWA